MSIMDERCMLPGRKIDLLTSEVDFPQAGQRLTSIASSANVFSELKKLRIRTRNQVRAILASSADDSVRLINRLRERSSAKELLQIDRVLRAQQKMEDKLSIPELFPTSPTPNHG